MDSARVATSDRPVRVEDSRDYRWLTGVWVGVALFALVTAVWSHHVGVPLRDPDGVIFQRRVLSSLTLFAVFTVVEAAWRSGRRGWRPREVASAWRRRWLNERLVVALSGLLAYHLVYLCYRNLKSWDAFNTPRDDDLLRADNWLFFGHSPAVLLHDLLGQGVAAHVLATVYTSFTQVVPVSFVLALVFAPRIRDGYVFLVAAMWVWVLGVASYYLIPSLGPFASAPQEFAGLPHTSITASQLNYLVERGHLRGQPGAGDAFASISAFASLHVGYTCMVVLMLRYYGLRLAAAVMTVYLAAVVLATVYFGWHFAVDDIAGVVLAGLAVVLGHATVRPPGRSLLGRRARRATEGTSPDGSGTAASGA